MPALPILSLLYTAFIQTFLLRVEQLFGNILRY